MFFRAVLWWVYIRQRSPTSTLECGWKPQLDERAEQVNSTRGSGCFTSSCGSVGRQRPSPPLGDLNLRWQTLLEHHHDQEGQNSRVMTAMVTTFGGDPSWHLSRVHTSDDFIDGISAPNVLVHMKAQHTHLQSTARPCTLLLVSTPFLGI